MGLIGHLGIARPDELLDHKLLLVHQNQDATLRRYRAHPNFKIGDNKVLYFKSDQDLPVIPSSMRTQVIATHHDTFLGQHAGVRRTLQLLRKKVWFKRMKHYVLDYIRTCRACQLRKEASR
jgi:hypothetical protein